MAGNWIKVEFSTADKPEILRISRILECSRVTAFGASVLFWIWLDKNSVDGHVDGVVDADVDAVVGLSGFSQAMQKVGWAALDGERLSVPHFERLNGESAKNRAMKSERQARWRAGKEPEPAPKRKATKQKGSQAGFEAFWAIYPRHEGRAAAEAAWRKAGPSDELQAAIRAAVVSQKAGGCLKANFTAEGRSTIPHGSSWLNGKRWQDEAGPSRDILPNGQKRLII